MLILGAITLVAWKGPTSALRWGVRTWDPALRLNAGSLGFREGSIVLRDVELFFRGRKTPILRIEELTAGLGPAWRSGRFGSLVLVGPVVSLDKEVLRHFEGDASQPRDGMMGGWEFGRLEIREGHLWLEEFGSPAMDISVNIDGVLERVGPGAPAQEHVLDLSGVYVAVHQGGNPVPLLGAGLAQARVSLGGLLDRKLAGLRVDQGWLLAGTGLETLASYENTPRGGRATSDAFTIEVLDLVELHIQTGETSAGLPQLSLKVNTALRDVGIGSAAAELAEKIHQVEFADIDILSPIDPLKRAVTVRTVFVKFSLAGLARKEVEELILLGPTIYVGEALFEYMQRADDAAEPPPEPVAVTEGWRVKKLEVNFGRLIIAVGGRSQVGLPLTFQTTAENVSLSSLAGLNLNMTLTIPPDDYDFPGYDLSFKNVRGDVRLNYPPQEDKNNLVNVVKFDRARWRNFTGSNLWISVTFDMEGINGIFGGDAYRGYVSGGFSFFLQPDAPWTGWITGTSINLGELTQAAAPQHFVMTGGADVKLELNGNGPDIDRVLGSIRTKGGGRLSVNKLNDLLEAIPPEWNPIKREVTRVGLEALRDFGYTKASGDFWFVGREGMLNAKMKGPSGSRNIEIVLHGDGSGGGAWSQRGGDR
ncbi:MAG: hypothetical protein IAE97_05155 [Chthoniobacterales bacterium]|nr:hypothetical protein [Chthoniobacterales bacterium]